MSRHRFIRNQTYDDDLDDDYEDFGSFSPNSPSAEQFMYNNRNRDQQNDLSNFVVTKPANKKGPNAPQEEEYEDDYDLVDGIMNQVYNTIGEEGVKMSDDQLADLIRECNYKVDLTIDKVLARSTAQPDDGMFSMDIEGDKPQKKVPPPGSNKKAAPASAKKAANNAPKQTDNQTGGRVTLAPQKYNPSPLAQQLTSRAEFTGNSDRDSNNAVKAILNDQNFSLNSLSRQFDNLPSDVKPFDFSAPSPDEEIVNKQKQAFSKKKVESVLTTPSEPLIAPSVPKVQPVVKKNLTPAQAKAASAKKPGDKPLEQVTKDLDRMNIDDEMRKSSEIKKTPRKAVKQMGEARRKEILNKIKEAPKGKDHLNMIVIGHVDAGKSTLMGHMLFLKGYVSQKTLAKYERDSRQIGKASFHYAWVLDEHEEERSRGITIDVAVNSFETDTKRITLLDAPGHRDFIPNMISGAAQADVGILVIRAGEGEFETAFSEDGQTKEHAILARSLGVTQLIVAVNQMDTVGWAQERYEMIKQEVLAFLKRIGFKETQLSFVPCSGLSGENLVERKEPKLAAWYNGPTLYNRIDNFVPAVRDIERPFRLSISDVYKDSNQSGGVMIAGKVEAGVVSTGDKLLLMPANEICTVKHVRMATGEAVDFATAGENVDIALTGIEIKVINFGNILCDPENPITLVRTITAQIITFNMPHPLVRGQSLYMFLHNLNEPVVLKKMVSLLDPTTGEVKQKRPRCLMDKSTAIVEIQTEKPLLLELYSNYKQLGRFTLREGNQTVAAGIITDLAWTSDTPATSNTNAPSTTESSK